MWDVAYNTLLPFSTIKCMKEECHNEDNIEFYSECKNDINLGLPEEGDYNELISKEPEDNYIGTKVLLPNGDKISETTMISRKAMLIITLIT